MLPDAVPANGLWLGKLGEQLGEEAVLAVRETAAVPWLEIQTHGGRAVVACAMELFFKQGLLEVDWATLVRRTALDPLRAEATIALTQAVTARTAAILLDQVHGAFSDALSVIFGLLKANKVQDAAAQLGDLSRWAPLGRHLTRPWRVAIVGPPNVGKSSLLNALAGYQRSVVDPMPGTTRDLVTFLTGIDGWPVELVDTAGLRDEAEELEQEGIGLARRVVQEADLTLWVLDASKPPVLPDHFHQATRFIVNKTDLAAAWDLAQITDAVPVSALSGAGLPDLLSKLGSWLVPNSPSPQTAIPFTSALADGMELAYRAARNGETSQAICQLEHLQMAFPSGTHPVG
jgi:tRNA modification GTPase